MFEGIKHNYSSDGMTGASYTDGEVAGYVSFTPKAFTGWPWRQGCLE